MMNRPITPPSHPSGYGRDLRALQRMKERLRMDTKLPEGLRDALIASTDLVFTVVHLSETEQELAVQALDRKLNALNNAVALVKTIKNGNGHGR